MFRDILRDLDQSPEKHLNTKKSIGFQKARGGPTGWGGASSGFNPGQWLELTPACASGDVEVVLGRTQPLEHLGPLVGLHLVRLAGVHPEFLGKLLPSRLHNLLLLHGTMLESQGRTRGNITCSLGKCVDFTTPPDT